MEEIGSKYSFSSSLESLKSDLGKAFSRKVSYVRRAHWSAPRLSILEKVLQQCPEIGAAYAVEVWLEGEGDLLEQEGHYLLPGCQPFLFSRRKNEKRPAEKLANETLNETLLIKQLDLVVLYSDFHIPLARLREIETKLVRMVGLRAGYPAKFFLTRRPSAEISILYGQSSLFHRLLQNIYGKGTALFIADGAL